MFGNMMKPVKGAGKSIMTMLKGTLVAGLLLAVLAFLESKYWTDTKDFIVNKVVPMLVDFYENILKPIGVIFADYFVATWEDIKTLFSGLGDAFDLFAKGEWWEGIKTMVSSIGTFLGEQIDLILTAAYNIIASVFGMSKTDSVFGSIWGFFTDTYDEVVSWIKITWFNIKTTISETWTNIKDSVVKVFTDVKDWFVKKWTWASDVVTEGWTSVKDWMQGVWDGVWGWFTKAWTWAKDVAVGTWTSVKDWMQGVWDGVWGWFTKAWTWASNVAVSGWTTVTDYIQGKWDTVVGWFKGLWTWGKATGATEEGGFSLTKIIDAAFLKAKDWVVSIFKWGTAPVGPKDSWIAKTIKDVIKTVKDWALSLFKWANTDEVTDPAGFSISGTVKAVIKTVIGWATGLFTWASEAGKVDGEEWSLTKMIRAGFDKAVTWVTDLFAWAVEKGKTPDGKKWSITKMISGVFKSAKDWFVGLFTWKKAEPKEGEKEFSISKMISDLWRNITQALKDIFPSLDDLKNMLPTPGELLDKLTPSWLGGGGDTLPEDMSAQNKEAEIKAVKEKMAATEERILQHNAELGKEGMGKHGPTQRKRYLDKLAVDQDKLGEQEAKLYELQKRRTGGPVKKGMPYLVGEGTVKPELFIPSNSGMIMSAERVAQMQSSGLRRGAGGSGSGGPAVVNAPVNTVNNSQSNTTVTSTELKHPSAILAAVNAAA
jgi:hypothetical protein